MVVELNEGKTSKPKKKLLRGDPGLKLWGTFLKSQTLPYRKVSFKHNRQLSFPFEMNLKIKLNSF